MLAVLRNVGTACVIKATPWIIHDKTIWFVANNTDPMASAGRGTTGAMVKNAAGDRKAFVKLFFDVVNTAVCCKSGLDTEGLQAINLSVTVR